MSYGDLVDFIRRELSAKAAVSLGADEIRTAVAPPLTFESGNKLAGRLAEDLPWLFSLERFIAEDGRPPLLCMICARDFDAYFSEQRGLVEKVMRELGGTVALAVIREHPH